MLSSTTSKSSLDTQHFDLLPIGIICLDRLGRVNYFNQQCKNLLPAISIDEPWAIVLSSNFQSLIDVDGCLVNNQDQYISIKTQPNVNNEGQMVILIDESQIKRNIEHKLRWDKINSIGKLSSTLAHQLKTPLSAALLYVSNLMYGHDNTDKLVDLRLKIEKQLHLIKNMIDDVLQLYKGSESILERFNLMTWLYSLIENYREVYPKRKFMVYETLNDQVPYLIGNKASLTGMINNIIDNALQASEDHIEIKVNVAVDEVSIAIKDYGCGIKESDLTNIYNPFFTTKKNGTGLGLSIAQSVAKSHGGQIYTSSKVSEYTETVVVLPLVNHE